MNDIVISPPNPEEIRQEFSVVLERAEYIEVNSKVENEFASHVLIGIRTAMKRVHERIDPIVGHAHKTHKMMTALRNDLLAPLNEADFEVSTKLNAYELAQREIAAAASEGALVEVEPDLAVVKGISGRTIFKAEVMDIVMLAEYVAANPSAAHLIKPDMSALNMLARAQQDAFAVPGCRLKREMGRSVRTGT